MDDAGFMRDVERVSELLRISDRLTNREGSSRDAIGQGLAVDQFEHQRRLTIALDDIVDGGDVGMIECRQCAGLAFEPQDGVTIGGDARRENLDRDIAAQARIAGTIHLAHSSCAEQRDNLVSADTRAGLEGQRGNYTIADCGLRIVDCGSIGDWRLHD